MNARSSGLAIYALTPQGLELGFRALEVFEAGRGPARIYASETLRDARSWPDGPVTWFSSLSEVVRATFPLFPAHLFITAAGIAVRTIAPCLGSKTTDPAVAVMDQKGGHVISLVSGHLGGANDLAVFLARGLGARAVITTATDAEGLPGLDVLARDADLAMPDMAGIRRFSAALLAGKPVCVDDPGNLLGLAEMLENSPVPQVTVRVGYTLPGPHEEGIVPLYPRVLCAGVGCKRGTGAGDIVEFVKEVFAANGLSLHSLAALASIDAKIHETGLLEAGALLGVPVRLFTSGVLAGFPVTAESPKAMETFGLPGVAEPAALAAARASGGVAHLLVPKQKGRGMTLAVALLEKP